MNNVPDTEVLRQILADTGTPAAEVVYIGDSLMKDVAMAQQAGVLDVLAGYGAVTDDAQYDLLRQVSHWTEADVDRERKLSAGADIVATYVLQHKFAEIFELFTFRSQRDRTRAR